MIDIETKRHFEELIDTTITRERKIFNEDMERYIGALKESFSDEVKLIAETVSSKPDEERVREIVHEEIAPMKTDIEIIKNEVRTINRELREHNSEMKQLRKDYNSHNKRLTRLENVLV